MSKNMKKSEKEEMFKKMRVKLVESIEKQMYELYLRLTTDPLLQGMVEVGAITEDEAYDLALDGFMNAADVVTEPDYE
jgi:uncharacterized protein YbcI